MTLSIFILATAILLAIYWFRYACRLMLKLGEHDRRAAAAVAERNWLSFPALADAAREGGTLEPAGLCRALDRDYRHLMYLARSGGLHLPAGERWLIAANYRLLSACFRTAWRLRLPVAVRAFDELLGLMLYLSHAVGRSLPAEAAPEQRPTPLCPTARSAI